MVVTTEDVTPHLPQAAEITGEFFARECICFKSKRSISWTITLKKTYGFSKICRECSWFGSKRKLLLESCVGFFVEALVGRAEIDGKKLLFAVELLEASRFFTGDSVFSVLVGNCSGNSSANTSSSCTIGSMKLSIGADFSLKVMIAFPVVASLFLSTIFNYKTEFNVLHECSSLHG